MLVLMKQLSTNDVGIDEVPIYFNIEYYFTKGVHNNITKVEQVHYWTRHSQLSTADIEIDGVAIYQ